MFSWGRGGKIALRTDKPFYVSGEIVTGKVTLIAEKPIKASAIVLKVTGKEEANWDEERSRQVATGRRNEQGQEIYTTEYFVEDYKGKREFFKEKLTLYKIAGELPPGTVEFPFQYKLPEGLPGTFEYKNKRRSPHNLVGHEDELKTEARVIYKFKATLDVDGFFAKDLKAKEHVTVRERLDKPLSNASAHQEAQVCFLCCIPRGKCIIDAKFNKNAYAPGEVAQIDANIDNQSSSKVSNMVVKLMRIITMVSDRGHRHQIVDQCAEKRYEGVPPKTKKDLQLPLPLPANLQPSTGGKYVQCSYRLDVECAIDYAPDIEAQLGVTVYAPQPPTWGQVIPGMPMMAVAPMAAPVAAPVAAPMMMAPAPMGVPMGVPMGQPVMMAPQPVAQQ